MQSQHLCLICGRSIDDHCERRRLQSDANEDCHSVLEDIASQRNLQLLQAPASTYLCKHPCFNDVKRLIKLRGDAQSLGKKIAERLMQTHNLDLPMTMPSVEVEPSPKRPCLSGRRQLMFTEATESPEVHVCIITTSYHYYVYTNMCYSIHY